MMNKLGIKVGTSADFTPKPALDECARRIGRRTEGYTGVRFSIYCHRQRSRHRLRCRSRRRSGPSGVRFSGCCRWHGGNYCCIPPPNQPNIDRPDDRTDIISRRCARSKRTPRRNNARASRQHHPHVMWSYRARKESSQPCAGVTSLAHPVTCKYKQSEPVVAMLHRQSTSSAQHPHAESPQKKADINNVERNSMDANV